VEFHPLIEAHKKTQAMAIATYNRLDRQSGLDALGGGDGKRESVCHAPYFVLQCGISPL
jgi:hypothetical protein